MRAVLHVASRWVLAASLLVAAVAGYASGQLLQEDSFAGLVSKSIENAEVRELLATKAVDIAFDATNADAFLADELPADIALIATPALELTKPVVAEAGATLLGVQRVEDALDVAARSVHRQTANAIVSPDDVDVVISALPVLVVVADEIAGDVGARAVVGLDLPDSATSINLGSNQGLVWSIVRGLSYVAAVAVLLLVVAGITYFVSAPKGRRLAAARRFGRTLVKTGIGIVVLSWFVLLVTAVALEALLAREAGVSFASISFGGISEGGGAALASVLLEPLLGSGRRLMMTGLVIGAATYYLGGGVVAQGLRETLWKRDGQPLMTSIRSELPAHFRQTQRILAQGFAVLLIMWPQITLRVVLTCAALATATFVLLVLVSSERAPWQQLRSVFAVDRIVPTDRTERSDRALKYRRWLGGATFVVALIWPRYNTAGVLWLLVLVLGAAALTYRWELRPLTQAALANELDLSIEDPSWSRWQKGMLAAAAAIGIALVSLGDGTTNPASAASLVSGVPTSCNGSELLCDRPVDEVVFAGTHNSMSASDLGWELANHEGAIPDQLDGGIRALLIDVQHWPQGESIEQLGLDPEAAKIAAAALSVSEAPEDGLWMCHKLCQLGGTPFSDFLADLRVFLETNPDEVLIVVIQDEAPASDIKAAIEAAEVDQYAFAHQPGLPWPTLGEMIEDNERIVFLAENEADDQGWYQLAFDGNVSETGFRYSVVEEFDCAPSRGGDDGPFFLINHWVETGLPVPTEADAVNSREVLAERVDDCTQSRGRAPGIIAVNFWQRGDLVEFVADLNG